MPLSRYQIRNEYSLADPELYRAADKDDPEALLEGVAMAGLVGVLRQLGDLAEFAAEVFHDLHEEVIATAARGHSLMGRVQQLEAEFPLIEKAFLSQTNHSSFFYNPGIDWHPNMHMDQTLITRGDLPRFVMDSYEECRGPPRLFLLDKFDVAGAGACLKRYTDPSFFKVEAKSLDITEAVQREKRTRKGKKRGSRWSNGGTPEVLPTSHAKLHQLLLEERIENNISDPARRVKLKRRLNGFPFDLKTGGSYMEKFLKISSEEHKVMHEISVRASPLKLPAKSTFESGLDIHDIRSESPDKKFRHGSLSPTPDMEVTLQNLSVEKLNGVTYDNGIYELPKANRSFKGDNILSIFHKEVGEKEIAADRESKPEVNIDGYQSDDVSSEVDNYVDALAIMESEIDTDSELRAKSDLHILSNKRGMSGFDANEAEHQAPFSDSQSMGSSMLSDDGNSSYKKEISSSSYSDTRSISAENIRLEGEVSAEGFISNDICEDKGIAKPHKEQYVNEKIEQAPAAERANDDGGTKVSERSDHREQTLSNLTTLPPNLAQVDADSTVRDHMLVEGEIEEMPSAHNSPETECIYDTGSVTNLNVSILGTSDVPLREENDFSPRVSAENQDIDGLDDNYPNVDDNFASALSEIPWHSRDTSSLAGSAKNQHLEDLRSEENLSSLSPTYQPVDELGDNKANMAEHQPESSPEGLPVNWSDSEDPIVISGASDEKLNVLTDASAYTPNNVNISQEDEKSNKSLDSVFQTENAEDDFENKVGNQTGFPISIIPHAEKGSSEWSLPEKETHNIVTEPDHIFSAPDDVILPAAEAQSLERSLPELDAHDTLMESDHIIPLPDDVALPATEEESHEQSLLELDIHDKVMGSDHIVLVSDDVIPPAAEIVVGVSSLMDSTKDVHSENLHTSRITDDIQPLDPEVNSTESSLDSPVPAISDLEEKYFERSVMESSKDILSEDLQTSGITDGIQPLEPALRSTDNQIASASAVMSQLDEQFLDLTWSELETHSKSAEPDDIIPDVNNMITSAGEIKGDIKPIMGSPNICDLKKLQASVKIDDGTQLDSAEPRISYNGEQNLHVLRSSEEGEKMDDIISPTDLVEKDTTNFMSSIDEKSLTRNLEVSDIDAERDDADTSPTVGFDDNAKDCGVTLSDLKKLDEESELNFAELNQSQMEVEVSVLDISTKSDVLTELGIPKVALPPLTSDLSDTLHHDHTEPEVLGNVPDLYSQVESSLDLGNAATTSPLQQSGLGTNAMPSQESNRPDYIEDISSLSIHHDELELKSKLSLHQLDKGGTGILQNAAEASLESLPQLEQKGSLDLFDQEGSYNTTSGSVLVNRASQPSGSKVLPQDNCSIGDIGQPKNPFSSSTAFALLPESKINLEDMPPLPPLPPVQWRMGKQQHASSLLQEKEALPSNVFAFPSFSPSIAVQEAQPLNPFLPHYDMANENSHLVYGYTSHNSVSDGPLLGRVPPMGHHESNTNSLPPLGETPLVNQLLLSREKFDEMSQNDSHVGENDAVQPSLSSFSQGTSVDTASHHASSLPHNEASQLQQATPETSLKEETLDQGVAPIDENMIVQDNDVIPPKIDKEQPQIVMPSLMGEIAWPSQDNGKANGGRTTKLPRPRNPLIDAVVAHDQSKLRKVAEHPRPQIQKDDERDTLLDQIRTKSFNLKPAVVSRPTIQGPTTNLRVAAILEKAKTIRMAFAGSDEDDDDSWSDS